MKTMITLTVAASILALAVPRALAQGRGMGRRGQGACRAGGGPGAGIQNGGWWNRVTPQTPEQKAVVDHVSDLHNRIRAANIDVVRLKTAGAAAAKVAEAEKKVAALRADLQAYSQANASVISSLGLPAGVGICDGTGRGRRAMGAGGIGGGRGFGRGMGAGNGRGMGMGLRNGTGPNPYCPLK